MAAAHRALLPHYAHAGCSHTSTVEVLDALARQWEMRPFYGLRAKCLVSARSTLKL